MCAESYYYVILRLLGHGLGPYRSSTIDTTIIIPFPVRKDKEQVFSERDCLLAVRAIQLRCFELVKLSFLFGCAT
jgi:hypothetical protein